MKRHKFRDNTADEGDFALIVDAFDVSDQLAYT